jgi:hypothetical protein
MGQRPSAPLRNGIAPSYTADEWSPFRFTEDDGCPACDNYERDKLVPCFVHNAVLADD